MKKLVIMGAGGHGKVVADCALSVGYTDIEFLDDNRVVSQVLGFPVSGSVSDADKYDVDSTEFFVAIGNNRVRIDLINQLIGKGCAIATLIHPRTVISSFAQVGAGTLVMPGAVINAQAKIGVGAIVNTGVCIDHDCVVGDGVHISPGAILSGTVKVGAGTWICSGAVISNNINIGSGSQVAAGAVVINNVDDFVLVAGVPATVKKRV
ncbi:MAG: acetyltransferase [Clostridia bacterium]|nr:acetyltransferase [Clostridia bacterium]